MTVIIRIILINQSFGNYNTNSGNVTNAAGREWMRQAEDRLKNI